MFNPLVDNFDSLTDLEIDKSISDLSKRYFQTYNPHVQQQIATLLEMYKQEAYSRREKALNQQRQQNGENDLDSLIKIS